MKTKGIGVLWDERYVPEEMDRDKPFYDEKLNRTMEYMAKRGRGEGIDIYVAHFSKYNKGKLERGYFFDGKWKTTQGIEIDLIFDKFYFDKETKKLKYRADKEVGVLNRPEFEELCKDKYKLYKIFPDYIPVTFRSDQDIEEILSEIRTDLVVLKPRFGSGGEGVKIVQKDEVKEELVKFDAEEVENGNIVLQEFKNSSEGIPFLDIKNVHDLRVITINGRPSYSFVRIPQEGYITNVNRGGRIVHVPLEKVVNDKKTSEILEDVKERLSRHGRCIYSVDIVFDREETPWIIELNSKPGIKFNGREVTKRKKQFIDDIISILKD